MSKPLTIVEALNKLENLQGLNSQLEKASLATQLECLSDFLNLDLPQIINAVDSYVNHPINDSRKEARINIVCSEKDKDAILCAFEIVCPFSPAPKDCGEDARCDECMRRHIDFDIVEDEIKKGA